MLRENIHVFFSEKSKASKMDAVQLLDFNGQRVFVVSLSNPLNKKIKM